MNGLHRCEICKSKIHISLYTEHVMLCSAPSKRMKFSSNKGFIVEQPSANSTTRITPNSLQSLSILVQKVCHIFSSIPDNSTMLIQRTHASSLINNTSHILDSAYATHGSVPLPSSTNAGEHESYPQLTTPEDNIDFDLNDQEGNVNDHQEINAAIETGSHLDQQSLSTSIVSNRFTSSEHAGIKLWNLLDRNNAPKCLYDEICYFIRSSNSNDLLHMPLADSFAAALTFLLYCNHFSFRMIGMYSASLSFCHSSFENLRVLSETSMPATNCFPSCSSILAELTALIFLVLSVMGNMSTIWPLRYEAALFNVSHRWIS